MQIRDDNDLKREDKIAMYDNFHTFEERDIASDLINSGENLVSELNPQQKAAVLHDEGPLLIIAGAGSGKTRVITHRIAYLVQARGVSPRNILAITFTNKAAKEMQTRVDNLLGSYISKGMWIGTFHSMMARILRRFANVLGFSNNFTIIDTNDQKSIMKTCISALNLNEDHYDARSVLNEISKAKNKLQSPKEYKITSSQEYGKEIIAKIYEKYQKSLLDNNQMDFDDLLYYPVILFRNNPDILQLYQDRFRYIMVDEYQDTNGAQYEIVRLLSSKYKNICVVGDDDQSIYSFRGANVQNILDFEHDFKHTKVIKLEQNYRSTAHILSTANAVIHNNSGRRDKSLWTSSEDGEKVIRLFSDNERNEAKIIADEINRLVSYEDFNYSDIAILYRINALSRNLEFVLGQAAIPFNIYGGLRFFERKEIKDVMAYLRLVTSPGDDVAFMRAITTPRRGIGNSTLLELQRIAAEQSTSMMKICLEIDDYDSLSRVSNKIKKFVHLIAKFQYDLLNKDWSLAEYIEYVERESGLEQDILDKKDKNREQAYSRLENMKELLSEAINFQNQAYDPLEWEFTQDELNVLDNPPEINELSVAAEKATVNKAVDKEFITESLLDMLIRFLDQSTLYSDLDQASINDEVDKQAVTLMTIHSSKGLEYKAVFIVGMEEGIFPGYRSMHNILDLEEERRLIYVAITRAKERLYLSASDNRLLFGRTDAYIPSRFIQELPDEHIINIGESNNMGRGFRANSNEDSKQSKNFNISSNLANTKSYSNVIKEYRNDRKANTLINKSTDNNLKVKKAGNLRANDIKVGDTVRHAKHGIGEVKVIEPVANDAILSIVFKKSGEKKMLANSANLARV